MSAIRCARRTSIAKRQLRVRARYRGIRPIPLCSNLLLIAHNLGGKNEGKLTNVRAPSDSCHPGGDGSRRPDGDARDTAGVPTRCATRSRTLRS